MIRDWRYPIIKMIEVLEAVHEADKAGVWEYHWPRVAASESTLAKVEERLGFRLDDEHRSFLSTANGWPWFSQSVLLFGSIEFLGSPALEAANIDLDRAKRYIEEELGLARSAIFPIAASVTNEDIFFMQVNRGVLAPPIVWLAGEEIDRYSSFGEFFLSMIEYSKLDLKALQR